MEGSLRLSRFRIVYQAMQRVNPKSSIMFRPSFDSAGKHALILNEGRWAASTSTKKKERLEKGTLHRILQSPALHGLKEIRREIKLSESVEGIQRDCRKLRRLRVRTNPAKREQRRAEKRREGGRKWRGGSKMEGGGIVANQGRLLSSAAGEALGGRIDVVRVRLRLGQLAITGAASAGSARLERSGPVDLFQRRLLAPTLARAGIDEGRHNAVHHLHISGRGRGGIEEGRQRVMVVGVRLQQRILGGVRGSLHFGMLGRSPPLARGCLHAS